MDEQRLISIYEDKENSYIELDHFGTGDKLILNRTIRRLFREFSEEESWKYNKGESWRLALSLDAEMERYGFRVNRFEDSLKTNS